jgi:hypothetical protein
MMDAMTLALSFSLSMLSTGLLSLALQLDTVIFYQSVPGNYFGQLLTSLLESLSFRLFKVIWHRSWLNYSKVARLMKSDFSKSAT